MVHGVPRMSYAMQQMKNVGSIAAVDRAAHATELWNKSIAVASICQIVARRTLLERGRSPLDRPVARDRQPLHHGSRGNPGDLSLGRRTLARSVDRLVASIGKAVPESWGLRGRDVRDAVGEQADHERRWKHAAGLSDVLIASLVLAEALKTPEPRAVATDGSQRIPDRRGSERPEDCSAILAEADKQISLVQ